MRLNLFRGDANLTAWCSPQFNPLCQLPVDAGCARSDSPFSSRNPIAVEHDQDAMENRAVRDNTFRDNTRIHVGDNIYRKQLAVEPKVLISAGQS